MKLSAKSACTGLPALLALAAVCCAPAAAQDPVITPIVVDTAVPIVINALKPKPSKWAKFEGTVMHANIAQITARAKGNDPGIQTIPHSQKVAAKMKQIVDKRSYQYGYKITIIYNTSTVKAMK